MTGAQFSPLSMAQSAGPIVRLVMLLLGAATIATWTILVAKTIELSRVRAALGRAEDALDGVETLADGETAVRFYGPVALRLVGAALRERERSAAIPDDHEGLKERIVLHLERLEALEGRRLMHGTGLLATIGATAPFIGLFGTVWGIMSSFAGIAASHATNLAVVAPGIAEALMATALGLVAAVPAVIIYNHLARRTAVCRAQLADLTSLVMRLVSRDLGRDRHNAFRLGGGVRPAQVTE